MTRTWLVAVMAVAACKTAEPIPEEPTAKVQEVKEAKAPEPEPAPLPMPAGLEEAAMDPSVSPCEDFYQYACGGWMNKTEIPAERPRWSRGFIEIEDRNQKVLREILDAAARGEAVEGAPDAKKLGDFYASCQDDQALETSVAVLQAEIAKIAKVRDPKSLAAALGTLHARGLRPLFDYGPSQDLKDATQVIAEFDQGGLGLPERDYYLQDDQASKAARADYLAHIGRVFVLLGDGEPVANAKAAKVMEVETALARASMPIVDRREPTKRYHRIDRVGLKKEAPAFVWDAFLTAAGTPGVQRANVAHIPFFNEVSRLTRTLKPADWHAYLTWHLVWPLSDALPKRFQDERFTFESKVLTGAKEDRPRWKKCVDLTDQMLGHALAQPFVARTFGAEGKATTQAMVQEIEQAFERNLESLDWMDAPTRARALEKVRKINNKIGYPDKWLSYEPLTIDRAAFLGNVLRAQAHELKRRYDQIGQPVDRTEWLMTPPTVNAYYMPPMNEIVFPAGILQPPFYNRAATDAVNFGAMGMVVGHEITHGFDDKGRKFGATGNLEQWWTEASEKEFLERAECVKRQYDGYPAIDELKVKGDLTLGENTADLGGLKLAFLAMESFAQKRPAPPAARLGPQQAFFLGYAQSWCTKMRPEFARVRALTDPHSPPYWRVNGPLGNLEQFRQAFSCPADAKMLRPPEKRCSVW